MFDSVYALLDGGTHQIVQRMFGSCTSIFRVTVVNPPKQQGGVFAIAVATCLALGEDPTKMVFGQARMRDNLMKCFDENYLTNCWV